MPRIKSSRAAIRVNAGESRLVLKDDADGADEERFTHYGIP